MTPPLIALTQRVAVVAGYGERRDALDQAWTHLVVAAGALPLLLPNDPAAALALVHALRPAGVLLTGGNDLVAVGGDAPERDATETALLGWCQAHGVPLLGVCRGMQVIQAAHGVPLERVEGHVAREQALLIHGRPATANSFHNWGARTTSPELAVWAHTDDGVVKAVRHTRHPVLGVMWHPERFTPFRGEDLALLRGHFGLGPPPSAEGGPAT